MRFSPGRQTLLGTTNRDVLTISNGFKNIVAGKGSDILSGTDDGDGIESLYGGLGDDGFKWSKGRNTYHGGQPKLDYEQDGNDTLEYDGVGDIFIEKNPNATPHILPDYFAHYSGGFDWLFSIERLEWNADVDTIRLGNDLEIIEDGLFFDFGDESSGGAANPRGDTLDLSAIGSGVVLNSGASDSVYIQTSRSAPIKEGLWVENIEWLIGTAGSDEIYLSDGMRGAEGGTGDDLIDARRVTGQSGVGPNGYAAELEGGAGSDTIISGASQTWADGGSGADTFILSHFTTGEGSVGDVEFVIEDADAGDRLFVPHNFFNDSDDGFEGSDLMPVLGAMGTYADMRDEDFTLQFMHLTEDQFVNGTDQVNGVITFAGAINFDLENDDLLISFFLGEVVEEEFILDENTTITYRSANILLETETIVRVKDFDEGDLGLVFHDPGEPVLVTNEDGIEESRHPNWDAAVLAMTNNGSLESPLDDRPIAPALNPNEDKGREERDVVVGSAGNDTIVIAAGASEIDAGDGDDIITGSAGNDQLDGGSGDDQLEGLGGDDTYIVDSANDSVIETANGGNDRVFASVDYTLPDHVETLTLTGTAALGTGNNLNNNLTGNDEDNTLSGSTGDDTLQGGLGNDTLDGGAGDDTYVYTSGDGDDIIAESGNASDQDRLILAGEITTTDIGFLRHTETSSDLLLTFAAGAMIEISGFFAEPGAGIDTIEFESGDIWDRATLDQMAANALISENAPPQAVADPLLIMRGHDNTIPADSLLANDRDINSDTFAIISVQDAVNATVTLLADGNVQVTTTTGFEGLVTFSYTIADTNGGQSTATVDVNVLPENFAPVAIDETDFGIAAGTTLILTADDVLANDLDDDDDPLTITSVQDATNGTVTLDGNGTITFVPDAGYTGPASFRYTIADPSGATSTATVAFTVEAITTVDGTNSSETLNGTSGWDQISGFDGNDIIHGLEGDDTILGGNNADTLYGEAGNDSIEGQSGDDTILGGSGNDLLSGGKSGDEIHGDDGHDEIYGDDGDDQIFGGAGRDLIDGGSGADTIYGGENSDEIYGYKSDDILFGESGFDMLFGGDGNDTISGGDDADVLHGDAGTDILTGDDGDDTLFGDSGADTLSGGLGSDILDGGSGNDTLTDDEGDDQLYGRSGTDILIGGAGSDILDGGDGSDTLTGGTGDDFLWGGAGKDTFIFVQGDGHDVIVDFETGDSSNPHVDDIDVSGLGYTDLASLLMDAVQDGDDTLITTDADTSLRLMNIELTELKADDFEFA